MCKFDTYIAVTDVSPPPQCVVLIDAATGALVRRIDPSRPVLYAVAGEFGGNLYLTTGSAEESAATRAYALQAAGLAGHSLTVYQLSATLGRGYPATLEIPA